jgi:DNA-binding MarR family transcriptional regulator
MKAHRSSKSGERMPPLLPMTDQPEGSALQTAAGMIHEVADVSRMLKNVTAELERLIHQASGTDELTMSHWLVLLHMFNRSTCKQVDLRSSTGIAPAYLSRLLDELVGKSLLRRHRSLTDRRQILLAPTASGKDMTRVLLTSIGDLITCARRGAIARLGSSLADVDAVLNLPGSARR